MPCLSGAFALPSQRFAGKASGHVAQAAEQKPDRRHCLKSNPQAGVGVSGHFNASEADGIWDLLHETAQRIDDNAEHSSKSSDSAMIQPTS
jgi:hypothetical protein